MLEIAWKTLLYQIHNNINANCFVLFFILPVIV